MNMTHRSTRAKDLQYEGWKIQVANICLEWALTNDKPLIFDEILEEEEEDKILENEILEMIEMWKIHRWPEKLENPKLEIQVADARENQSIDKEVGNSKVGSPNVKRVRRSRTKPDKEKPHVYTSLTTEKAETEVRQPASKKPPKSYEKAIESPEGDLWGEGMEMEKH